MIPGITASAPASGAIVGGDNPLWSGANLVLDFEAGVYRVAGVDADPATLIDRVDTISGAGLTLDWNTSDPPIALLTAAIDAIDIPSGFTVLFDYRQYDQSSYEGVLLEFWNGTFSIPGRHHFYLFSADTFVHSYDRRAENVDPSLREVTTTTDATANGARRVYAVTRAADRLSQSINGGAVESDVAAAGVPSFTTYMIGGNAGDAFLNIDAIVKRIIFYPPIDDADLPSYTA